MSNIIANRLQQIKPSATLAISAKAAELKAQGIDVISLASGEPDFAPPAHVLKAAKQAIDDGMHYYTPVDGIPSLKQAIQAKLKRDHQLDYDLDQIIVSTGAKQCLYNSCQALLNPSDEMIIPAPYWVSYPALAQLAEGEPVIIETASANDYKITPEQLEQAITPKTKLLVLNSPSNPTGMVYSANELAALGEVLKQNPEVFIVSDDIYEYINWSDAPYSNILMACPELKERTLIVNGVSKAYAMTGWRIGYTAGPADIIKAMKKIQSQSTSNANAVAQKAAEAAITGPQDCIANMVSAYQRRQKLMLQGINQISGLHCKPTEGAFYLFVDASEAIKKQGLSDDIELCTYLLDQAQVALVPGTAFGASNHFRLSYATSDELLQTALERLAKALN